MQWRKTDKNEEFQHRIRIYEKQVFILRLKNTSEIKNSLDGSNSTIDMAKERVNQLEDRK
jgi:uncharacterized protein YwlG (UPF0340 family)